jgi:hypothetical protein
LKKHLFKLVVYLFVILLMISSGTALYFQLTESSYDPIKAIQKLKSQNRREEALDLVKFYEGNKTVDAKKIEKLKDDLEYTSFEKLKSFTRGAIKGEIKDTYSGLGAISSDLTLYGDVRDLCIQTFRYLKDEKTDAVVAALSGIGIILSAKPFLDIMASYAKNTVKYLRNVSGISSKNGIIKKILKGDLSLNQSKQICDLLKKTHSVSPAPQQSYLISAV